ncbi:fungal-specific transcription factor domain-containing protein [Rhexocercosporidium sp. MPI-PUGE-AT-0058]|nr:fungal-specific transcription factor domain-containing protein [Rhexocercosporidium sp. MPI-PUGE-AT-0058]
MMSERGSSREPTNNTPGAESEQRSQSRKFTRIRFACLRCQKRKIKCDGGSPVCSSCRKAGAACIDGAKQNDRCSKAYVASLQDRVRWLEEKLATHCPGVDVSSGPRLIQENNLQSGEHYGSSIYDDTQHTAQASLPPAVENPQPERLAHEIGLVSVTAGQDLRYVGPSSGYSFAKLLFASIGRRSTSRRQNGHSEAISTVASEAFQVGLASLPSSFENAVQLSQAYWDTVHFQYPILHQSTHAKLMSHVFATESPSPVAAFQVFMVLAISTTILSRRLKLPLSAEGYCVTAMGYFDKISIEGSLEGLQCLLLLQVYGMYNPSMGLNLWYLNYQCIASVLDLGLQRDVRAGRNLSFLTQEMRTRIFWVVYSLDRTLATIMGRPIGLRDEACELRLPVDIDDDGLLSPFPSPRLEDSLPTSATIAIHLFKLSQLNSEIKYIANSISRKTPAYSYPQIPDILQWQADVLGRLQQWATEIPQLNQTQTKLSEIKYHEVVMLLLRPSPAIPNPSHESLHTCHQSSIAVIRTFDQLYRGDLLVFNWQTLHSIFLATVTMLYCTWSVPSVTRNTSAETLMMDLKISSNVLSALAEHFVDVSRGRDILDELSSVTVRWMMDSQNQMHGKKAPNALASQSTVTPNEISASRTVGAESGHENGGPPSAIEADTPPGNESSLPTQLFDDFLNSEPWESLFGRPDDSELPLFQIDTIMQNVFNDFQPDVEFGQSLALDNILMGDPVL